MCFKRTLNYLELEMQPHDVVRFQSVLARFALAPRWVWLAWLAAALVVGLLSPRSVGAADAAGAEAMRTIEVNSESITKGKVHFATCSGCHGMNGEGRMGMAPRLNSKTFLAAASDEMLVRTISAGRPGTTMVPWGMALDKAAIDSIVAYMRSWTEVVPAQLDESVLNGNVEAGAQVFASICAACHGKSGGGYMESANGTGIGRKSFLDSVSNGFIRYLTKHGKSNTPMRPFALESKVAVANLTDQQIEDVIAFLRNSAW